MISYEWVVEDNDVYDDIVDLFHCDTMEEAIEFVKNNIPIHHYDVALTRLEGNNDDGLIDRQYAYLLNGKLPEEFDNGTKVPKRFKI